jgi:hypothetical protein
VGLSAQGLKRMALEHTPSYDLLFVEFDDQGLQ